MNRNSDAEEQRQNKYIYIFEMKPKYSQQVYLVYESIDFFKIETEIVYALPQSDYHYPVDFINRYTITYIRWFRFASLPWFSSFSSIEMIFANRDSMSVCSCIYVQEWFTFHWDWNDDPKRIPKIYAHTAHFVVRIAHSFFHFFFAPIAQFAFNSNSVRHLISTTHKIKLE